MRSGRQNNKWKPFGAIPKGACSPRVISTMNTRSLALSPVFELVSLAAAQQTTPIILANEAAAHVSQYATVQGVVAKGVHIQKRQHVPQYRRCLSQPDFHRLDSAVLRPKANSLSPN